MNHILLIDLNYLAILAGRPAQPGPLDRELHADLASLTAAQTAADRQLVALCEALTPDSLAAVVRWPIADGGETQDAVHTVLSHLFVHQIHHRGQMHDMLSSTGVKPLQLDEFFLVQDAGLREEEVRRLGIGS